MLDLGSILLGLGLDRPRFYIISRTICRVREVVGFEMNIRKIRRKVFGKRLGGLLWFVRDLRKIVRSFDCWGRFGNLWRFLF